MSSTDLTAKVLATENIHIIRKNVKTAYFNLKDRVLTLPSWKDMTPEAENMLMCHEVSHALFTPDQYTEEVQANRKIRSYLNVLEDIRAEKLFQEQYPGSRKNFISGYKSLMDRDFFGLTKIDVADLNLIDRINIYFKAGMVSGVKFKRHEQKFVEKISKLVTFQDVVDLANEIYTAEKERIEKKKEEDANNEELQEEMKQDSSWDDEDYDGEENEEEDDSMTPSESSDDQEETDETDGSEESSPENEEDSDSDEQNDSEEDELESNTQKEFDDNLENTADESYNPVFLDMKAIDFEYIISYKKIMDRFAKYGYRYDVASANTFKQSSNKQVSHITQQFELKKAADIYSRRRITKSGNLDVNRVATYKIKSDVFRRNVKIPNGQNHGMIMLLDWSGSMSSNDKIHHSIRQSIQLALFCRKVNIPFRIYAFSSNCSDLIEYNSNNFYLKEFFSSEMSSNEFNLMISYMVSDSITSAFRLGTTPLAPALYSMLDVIPKFKSEYKLDKVSLISFTDGGNTMDIITNYTKVSNGETKEITTDQDVFLKDSLTKKNYKLRKKGERSYGTYTTPCTGLTTQCTGLYEMIKDRYGINTISFMVATPNELGDAFNGLGCVWVNNFSDKKNEFVKERYLTVNAPGRDAAYIVHPGMLAMDEMSTSAITGDMTASKISKVLMKTSKKSLKNKILLEKFISVIS